MIDYVFLLISLLWFHYVADFLAQSRWMGENKSKDWSALSTHILTYSSLTLLGLVFLFLAGPLIISFNNILLYVFINSALHFVIDAITSRFTAKFYEWKEMHWFWSMIGFDQFLHTSIILLTAGILI